MCGIVGITGHPDAVAIVLEGLSRLEYRGYDSAGIAAQTGAAIEVRKAVGKLANLRSLLAAEPLSNIPSSNMPTTAIGHTRWATHGSPTAANAHPHLGQLEGGPTLAVVHNGIIENYQSLRTDLAAAGASFLSDTDTEVIPYAVAAKLGKGLPPLGALLAAAKTFHGNYAVCVLVSNLPDTLLATRRGAPLCLAQGKAGGKPFTACVSDPLALAGVADTFTYLEDGDVVLLRPSGFTVQNAEGKAVTHPTVKLDLSADLGGKQGYAHFMLKEIHEQPAVVARILQDYSTADGALALPRLPDQAFTAVNIVACGTAYLAGMVGKSVIEEQAGIPVNVDVASEFRYRNPPLVPGGLFIAVSQSGETADTLAALEYAKAHGQHILALTNVPTSSIARAAHTVIDLKAGREVAVASTKAFTAMVLVLTLLALRLGKNDPKSALAQLRTLPSHIEAVIGSDHGIADLAKRLADVPSMLYLGRGLLAPIAYEGALKMKEISYIHAEGYASGEMKHGPIALVDDKLPVVNLAAGGDGLFEKTLSNLREVEARKGRVILITDTPGAVQLDPATRMGLTLITLPTVEKLLLPMLFAIPLQLLAYHTAIAKGTDVDQPRNLAKSVTVE